MCPPAGGWAELCPADSVSSATPSPPSVLSTRTPMSSCTEALNVVLTAASYSAGAAPSAGVEPPPTSAAAMSVRGSAGLAAESSALSAWSRATAAACPACCPCTAAARSQAFSAADRFQHRYNLPPPCDCSRAGTRLVRTALVCKCAHLGIPRSSQVPALGEQLHDDLARNLRRHP